MKKTLIALLAALMLISALSACGGDTSAPATEPGETPLPFSFGLISEDEKSYTNEYADMTFTLPEDWIFATREEIAVTTGLDEESIAGGRPIEGQDPKGMQMFYDMMAASRDGQSNLAVMFQYMKAVIGGSSMSEDEYLANMREGIELTYNDEGYSYTFTDPADLAIAGYDYRMIRSTIDTGVGVNVYQTCCVRRAGDYMLSITFTGTSDDPLSELGDCFS